MALPRDVVNYILGFHEKEFYWDKFSKTLRIRFIQNFMDDKLSYLFSDITSQDYHNCCTVEIGRRNVKILIAIFHNLALMVKRQCAGMHTIKVHTQCMVYLNKNPLMYIEVCAKNIVLSRKPVT